MGPRTLHVKATSFALFCCYVDFIFYSLGTLKYLLSSYDKAHVFSLHCASVKTVLGKVGC